MLRGFFIFVIIVDHMQRWPSPLTALTGQGRLWVSAAEGFFIISGLLIGYLRGYRQHQLPFRNVAAALVKRAATLYLAAVVITLVGELLLVTFHGDPKYVPKLPDGSPGLPTYLWQVITQQYVFEWIYFLRLYWMMLLATPLAILLFRSTYWWLVPIISLGVYGLSFLGDPPEGALQWQVLFFVAATIGFKLDAIRSWIKEHGRRARVIGRTAIIITLTTMLASYFWVLGWGYVESGYSSVSRSSYVATRDWLDPIFAKYPLMPGRVALAFVWFGGLLLLFHMLKKPLMRWAGWLLVRLGSYSLTAYCIQALLVYGMQIIFPISDNRLYNLLVSLLAVLGVWALLGSRWVRAVFPR